MTGKVSKLQEWNTFKDRMKPGLRNNFEAAALAYMSEQAFEEYEQRLAEADRRVGEMEGRYDRLTLDVKRLADEKDTAYGERDRLVAALSKLFVSHLCQHPAEDTTWEDGWQTIVCVHLPAGQATWHIHDSELSWFGHLSQRPSHWDGHDTEEKYGRLGELTVQYLAELYG